MIPSSPTASPSPPTNDKPSSPKSSVESFRIHLVFTSTPAQARMLQAALNATADVEYNVVITADANDTITLAAVHKSSLNLSDFPIV
jgi:hypothetical protein